MQREPKSRPNSAAGQSYVAAQAGMHSNYFDKLGRNCRKRGGESTTTPASKQPTGSHAAPTQAPRDETDVYQLGRAACGSIDIVVRGRLHECSGAGEGAGPALSGPISKYACRIECSRVAPFDCRIYAGGWDHTSRGVEVMLGERSPRWWCPTGAGENLLDGFTTYGLRVFQPQLGEWFEVSARGIAYRCRPAGSAGHSSRGNILLQAPPTARITDPRVSNLLMEGSLIDIGGVTLAFQSPATIFSDKTSDITAGRKSISCLNRLRPYCPVLFSRLNFVFISQKIRGSTV